MTLEEIRERHQATPFQPFTLRLSSGRQIPVHHPEFMGVPPMGGLIAVWDGKGHLHVVDIGWVEEIDYTPQKKPNGRRHK